MTKLKTLNDIEHKKELWNINNEIKYKLLIPKTELKEEAIKWYKKYAYKNTYEDTISMAKMEFIIDFFNLTDEDLK